VVDPYEYALNSNSLALDDRGHPCIAYSTYGELRYARWNGSAFTSETVSLYGSYDISLALDAFYYPHISYFDGANRRVEYAIWNGTAWNIEVVDSVDTGGWFTSLALDSNGNSHISYVDYHWDDRDGDLKYAKRAGGTWSSETLDSEGAAGFTSSIAIDSNDYPHISYLSYIGGHRDLKYARWNGTAWNIETVDSSDDVGAWSSIAIDSNDYPHISYFDITNHNLKYTRWNGTAWNIETVDPRHEDWEWQGEFSSLALDRDDYPHISFYRSTYSELKYARWNGTAWNIEVVEAYGLTGHHTSISLDADDNPHISYFNFGNDAIKYATKAELGPLPQPILSYSPQTLDFGSLVGDDVQTKTFEIWNSGDGILTYTVSEDTDWITDVGPRTGSSKGEHDMITVSIDTTGLSAGIHTSSIQIASNGGNGSITLFLELTLSQRSITLNIDPDTFNLKSRGKWITVYLMTVKAVAEDIEASSLLLNNIAPEWWVIQNGTTLILKIDRSAVHAILAVSDSVNITITGQWKDGEPFETHDYIVVSHPGR
jgi:hypothetical protein